MGRRWGHGAELADRGGGETGSQGPIKGRDAGSLRFGRETSDGIQAALGCSDTMLERCMALTKELVKEAAGMVPNPAGQGTLASAGAVQRVAVCEAFTSLRLA